MDLRAKIQTKGGAIYMGFDTQTKGGAIYMGFDTHA
jgi:hypothetical protein